MQLMFFNEKQFYVNGIIAVIYLILILSMSRAKEIGVKSLVQLEILGFLYPFGETLQALRVVPSFIRWHLSDFGAVAMTASILTLSAILFRKPIVNAQKFLYIFTSWLVLSEIVEMVWKSLHWQTLFTGDWWDVVMFVVSYKISIHLMKKAGKESECETQAFIQVQKRIIRKERKRLANA